GTFASGRSVSATAVWANSSRKTNRSPRQTTAPSPSTAVIDQTATRQALPQPADRAQAARQEVRGDRKNSSSPGRLRPGGKPEKKPARSAFPRDGCLARRTRVHRAKQKKALRLASTDDSVVIIR